MAEFTRHLSYQADSKLHLVCTQHALGLTLRNMTSVSERLDLNEARESKRFARLVVMEPLSSAEQSDDSAACATQIPPYNL